MGFLCNDRFAPITSEIGFLEAPAHDCAGAFVSWQQPLLARRGVTLEMAQQDAVFPDVLDRLLPLTSIERRRYLFLPTKGPWTTYFDNGWSGGDPASTVSYLAAVMNCRGIRAACVPHTVRPHTNCNQGRYGAVILEVYGGGDPLVPNTVRSVYAANDGGRWVFGAHGEQLGFETPQAYKARRIKDRFTPAMLCQYLQTWGIDLFDEAFYSAQENAFLVWKTGPCANGVYEYALEDVRATF